MVLVFVNTKRKAERSADFYGKSWRWSLKFVRYDWFIKWYGQSWWKSNQLHICQGAKRQISGLKHSLCRRDINNLQFWGHNGKEMITLVWIRLHSEMPNDNNGLLASKCLRLRSKTNTNTVKWHNSSDRHPDSCVYNLRIDETSSGSH